jgi:hypothetical protein
MTKHDIFVRGNGRWQVRCLERGVEALTAKESAD